MTTITQQQLTRDLGEQHLTLQLNKRQQTSPLNHYQGIIHHGGRVYRVSILVPRSSAAGAFMPISELATIAGAHIQIEVFALFAMARFNVPVTTGLH